MIQSELNTDFGTSVCINNNQVFVGARIKDDLLSPDCGAVYIYDLDILTGKVTYNSILWATDRDGIDNFGCSISVRNNLAIVGAFNKENMVGVYTGAAYIFEKIGGTWIEKQKITSSNGLLGDRFGSEVSTDGNLIAVSALGSDNNSYTDAGSVYIYSYSFLTNSASQQQIINSPDPKKSGNMGRSLMLFNNNLLVGATCVTGYGPSTGKVFCYNLNTYNSFDLYNTLMGDNPGIYGDEFGWSLCFDNESLVIGAPNEKNGNSKGSVYYYYYYNSDWEFFQKEKYSCYNEYSANFGRDVAVNGLSSIVGDPHTFYSPLKNEITNNAAICFHKRGTSLIINAGDNRTICPGDAVTIGGYPTAIGGVPPYNYKWTTNIGQVSTLSNFSVTPTATTTYYLEVKDQISGCSSLNDQVTITILPTCPCQYPVYIDGIENPTSIPLKNSAMRSIAIANKPSSTGAIALTGFIETNVLTISNGYSRTHPQSGFKQFICKLNNKGYTQWSHLMDCGSNSNSTINPVSCHVLFTDNQDNTYLAQNFKNKVIFEDYTEIRGITNTSYWNQSIYVVKFDPSGSIKWNTVILDGNGLQASFFDMSLSDNAVYIMGATMSGFSLSGHTYLPGNFLLKIDKVTGALLWCQQDYQGAICYITIDENNRIFIQTSTYPGKVYEINPATGALINNYDKSLYLSTSLISFNSGGSSMFYEIIGDPTFLTSMAIRGYKFENAGGIMKFNYKKSIEAPHKDIQGMSAVDNMVYFRKVTIDDFPDKFRKVDMLISPPNDIKWTQNTPYLSCIRPSTRSNPSYGYFVAADFTHNNDFIINSFNTANGAFGVCPVSKSFNIDYSSLNLPNEINKAFEVFPNPAKDILYVSTMSKDNFKSIKIEGFNSFGQKVLEKLAKIQNDSNIEIDISKLPIGVYFFRFTDCVSDSETFKVIKK